MYAHLLKVGHFTMDNASNNGTMMQALKTILARREIEFDANDRKIMCFAHVIDLCSGRVIRAASEDNLDEDEDDSSSSGTGDTVASDPIALARAVVRTIRGSGARRDYFQETINKGNEKGWFKQGKLPETIKLKPLELLRDVRTRWDSVFYMLHRLHEMRPVCRYTLPNVALTN